MNLNRQERLELLIRLGNVLRQKDAGFDKIRNKAFAENPWFIPANIDKALNAIVDHYLEPASLREWMNHYPPINKQKKVGLIMAGNIPFVGFHDFLSVFASGHKAQVKLSSKDTVLMQYVFSKLRALHPAVASQFELVERLEDFDAVIATGSNNTSRYFEYYFGKYPNIIRKNRNGTAVLTGDERADDLKKLSEDISDYFGLGCRNVTKIYVPENYDFEPLLSIFEENQVLFEHHKYRNNYDYNYAIYLLNREDFMASKNILLKEDTSYLSRIACLHYEKYTDLDKVKQQLEMDEELIQCVATRDSSLFQLENEVAFGQTQVPGLFDYADGVDTLSFLTHLS